jgi:capsular polysaccharide transport system permease protein
MAEEVSLKPGPESARASVVTSVSPASVTPLAAATKPRLVAAAENAAEVERQKVVHIVRRLRDEALESRVLKKRPWLTLSVLACVALPTFVAALFYIFIAADRYVSEARFAVRSNEAQAADALGMITGLPSSATVSDSYIVADYIESRDMVIELEKRLPLREMYRSDDADYFSRLGGEVTLEDLVAYWQSRIDVYYDSTKSTIAVEVQAFAPGDAERIAGEIVDITRRLVNDLSAQARRDAVEFAASEVMRAELRVRGAREDMLEFRLTHNELDPTQSAEATLTLAAELKGERSRLASQLASLTGYLSDDAPSIQMLKSRIAALDGEVASIEGRISHASPDPAPAGEDTIRGAIESESFDPNADASAAERVTAESGASSDAMANVVGDYQELLLNQEFAEKAYTAAMGSLERARTEASRNQSYLAIYAKPVAADAALYPNRFLAVLIVLIISATLWATGAFAVLTVKDHLR